MLDGANFTSAGHLDLLTSRGGKEEDAPSSQATQGSNPLSAGASASALSRGRGRKDNNNNDFISIALFHVTYADLC